MKNRFRRVPGEMSLSREWEALPPDARFLWLQATVSPRQTAPGVYDGTEKGLAHETGLSVKRVRAGVEALAAAGVMREVPEGGYHVRDSFRWSAANPDFVMAAVRMVTDRWPSLLTEFIDFNRPIFERFAVEIPRTPHRGPTVAAPSPHRDVREVEVKRSRSKRKVKGEGKREGEGGRTPKNASAFVPSPSPPPPRECSPDGGTSTAEATSSPSGKKRPETVEDAIALLPEKDRRVVRELVTAYEAGAMTINEMTGQLFAKGLRGAAADLVFVLAQPTMPRPKAESPAIAGAH